MSVIRTHHRQRAHATAANEAVDDLRSWPGERWSHLPRLGRAWELRDHLRGYDALYVALAEALEVVLLTLHQRHCVGRPVRG
ncbi:MAG: type II toxin-antitoxin system VapC family toxin [Acidimicrobiia bacterium]